MSNTSGRFLLAFILFWCLGCTLAAEARSKAEILAPTNDFSVAEKWESLSGGSATNRKRFDSNAFSLPSANLSFESRADFFVGNGLFKRLWVSSPASTKSADGLGPLFNARACQRCHLKDGRGHPPESATDSRVSFLLKLAVPAQTADQKAALASGKRASIADPIYGNQLQDLGTTGHLGEGRVEIRYEPISVPLNGEPDVILQRPIYTIGDPAYGPLTTYLRISPRVAPPMIGLGLLEAIAESDLAASADPQDLDGDGISGRLRRVWSPTQQKFMAGRFGWRANTPTVIDQVNAALSNDMGLSNPSHQAHWGDCTERQTACRRAPHGATGSQVEVTAEMVNLMDFYSRHLAVPARRQPSDPPVLAGKKLFYDMGCVHCHTPKHATRTDWPDKTLAGQLIWPYTNLLLHDMGEALADDLDESGATGREWRTPPLWGIGLTSEVNGHTRFLHDGRARSITEAVLWHGGEAEASRERFQALDKRERAAVLKFLNSL